MYLIKLITQRYIGNSNDSVKIIGYVENIDKAQEYCDKENPKLEYNKNMGHMYYTFDKIEKVD